MLQLKFQNLLRAEVKSSRSAGIAERALLTMMFPMETLLRSSVMGKRIKKDEPAKAPLDKLVLNKLFGKLLLTGN